MTQKEKSKEIERICNKINAYYDERRAEINELNANIKRIKKEANNTIKSMIVSECAKKDAPIKVVNIILKDTNFITTKGKQL